MPLDPVVSYFVFSLVCRRYEKAAMIWTSNKSFSEWASVFAGDEVLTAANLDRLLHHGTVINIGGSNCLHHTSRRNTPDHDLRLPSGHRAHHSIENCQQLTHIGNQGHFLSLTSIHKALVESSDDGIAPRRYQCCHIQVANTLYSVPYQYVGKMVDVKLGSIVVEIYLDYELIKTHSKGDKGRRVTDWNDYPPEKAAFFQRTPEWYRHKASLIGTSTRETVESLLKEHAFHHLRQCQGILRLREAYGEERLEQACARANAFGDPCYRTVKTILERGLDKQPLLFEPVRVAGAFLRGPESFP